VQKLACCHVRVVLPFGFRRYHDTIGPVKPHHIKTILSGPLPIFIDYEYVDALHRPSGSVLWRLQAALEHRDRVREISIDTMCAKFDKFFKEIQCDFPVLESFSFGFGIDYKPKLSDTFLGGPNLFNLHLRRLTLKRTSLASISEFLLSATALTHLSLKIDTTFAASAETSLLACLQGMPCLHRLHLSLILGSPFQPSIPWFKDIVPLSELICFSFVGNVVFLDTLVAGLSAPSLRDVDLRFYNKNSPLFVHLPRFINEMEERYHAIHLVFEGCYPYLLLLTQLEFDGRCKPRFKFGPVVGPYLELIISALSTRLTTVEEFRVTFGGTEVEYWELTPWRSFKFLRHLPSVKAFRTEGKSSGLFIACTLFEHHEEPDDNLTLLPGLEEVELDKDRLWAHMVPLEVACKPFISARQRAGRPVKVFFGPQLESVGPAVDESPVAANNLTSKRVPHCGLFLGIPVLEVAVMVIYLVLTVWSMYVYDSMISCKVDYDRLCR
jgi:hypothetical protein